MRIWLDPHKLQGYGLSTTQVLNAVEAQNAQFAAGAIGADPAIKGRSSPPPSRRYALHLAAGVPQHHPARQQQRQRGPAAGRRQHLLGGQSYGQAARHNGQPAGGVAVFLSPGTNALAVADAVKAQMAELARTLPPGVNWTVPYDTTPFITASIHEVLKTLASDRARVPGDADVPAELRATLIPTLVIPVALIGTFVGLAVLHLRSTS